MKKDQLLMTERTDGYPLSINFSVGRGQLEEAVGMVLRGEIRDGKVYIGDEAVLDAEGRADRKVWVGIRPEGFIPDPQGPFTCQMDRVEVMGRDVSVVSTHAKMTGKSIRSIVSSENRFEPGQKEVCFRLKPHKVFLFDRESEERV